ncbi:unnamed protein product [Bursaphelenchus okinawaensis]|uniref:Uncharacterized protein n=1 Tax=Bursaphelenchus okinawaensis TaxID=465554 RepID=A0A811L3R2_9BILA|nr:unnamed protein product [Bursaphelenchus okinawaensis]CAG9115530.1 unnamed protein product [Bursaphelenchus okinawaensis]
MMPRSRRGFQAASAANPERVRTHLLFSSQPEHHTAKRKRRPHNKFQSVHKKDEMIQANPDDLDPTAWTGNQRVLHFGPMANRDPFFYYYPKGWDILYPAQFGFFPYRTRKFRGNSVTVCVWAFGVFLLFGGALMSYFGYFVIHDTPFWMWKKKSTAQIPPVQVAGPIMLVIGILLVLIGLICSICTSEFLNEKIRHYHHRGQPASVTVYTTHIEQPKAVYEKNPYQPLPPPAYPVLENKYAHSSGWNPYAELKLFPPVMPGYSTLSLHGEHQNHGNSPSVFVASPYNTLRAMSANRFPVSAEPLQNPNVAGMHFENASTISGSVGSRRQSMASNAQRRAKSVGQMPKSRESSVSRRFREMSQNN